MCPKENDCNLTKTLFFLGTRQDFLFPKVTIIIEKDDKWEYKGKKLLEKKRRYSILNCC